MGLIAVTSIGCLLTAYQGLFSALGGLYGEGALNLLIAFPLGFAAYLLAKHRGDLVGD
jgi:hypothetical protein